MWRGVCLCVRVSGRHWEGVRFAREARRARWRLSLLISSDRRGHRWCGGRARHPRVTVGRVCGGLPLLCAQ
jgi:hypothetical protein